MLGCWHAVPGKRPSFERLNDNFLIAAKVLAAEIRTAARVAGAGRPTSSIRSATDGYEREREGAGGDDEAGRSALAAPGVLVLPGEIPPMALDADGYVEDVQPPQPPSHEFDEEGYVAETHLGGGMQPAGSSLGTAPLDSDGYVQDVSLAAAPRAEDVSYELASPGWLPADQTPSYELASPERLPGEGAAANQARAEYTAR